MKRLVLLLMPALLSALAACSSIFGGGTEYRGTFVAIVEGTATDTIRGEAASSFANVFESGSEWTLSMQTDAHRGVFISA